MQIKIARGDILPYMYALENAIDSVGGSPCPEAKELAATASRKLYAKLSAAVPQCRREQYMPLPKSGGCKPPKILFPAVWRPDYAAAPRRVVCAAIQHQPSGRIISGPRHFDSTMREQIYASEGFDVWRNARQGFVDQFGLFMDRETAWRVAETQGQIRRTTGTTGTLYSEDLY